MNQQERLAAIEVQKEMKQKEILEKKAEVQQLKEKQEKEKRLRQKEEKDKIRKQQELERKAEEAREAAQETHQKKTESLMSVLTSTDEELHEVKKSIKDSEKHEKHPKQNHLGNTSMLGKDINLGFDGLKNGDMEIDNEKRAEMFNFGKNPLNDPLVKAKLFGKTRNDLKLWHQFNLDSSIPMLTKGFVSINAKKALSDALVKKGSPLHFALSSQKNNSQDDQNLNDRKNKNTENKSNLGFEKLLAHLGGGEFEDEEGRRLKLSSQPANQNKPNSPGPIRKGNSNAKVLPSTTLNGNGLQNAAVSVNSFISNDESNELDSDSRSSEKAITIDKHYLDELIKSQVDLMIHNTQKVGY